MKLHEQLTKIPAELTDQLVFDVSKTYYYSVIESLCRLIRSIQQGQRTTLVSLAKIIQEQRDEIEKYQTLLKLPEEVTVTAGDGNKNGKTKETCKHTFGKGR